MTRETQYWPVVSRAAVQGEITALFWLPRSSHGGDCQVALAQTGLQGAALGLL